MAKTKARTGRVPAKPVKKTTGKKTGKTVNIFYHAVGESPKQLKIPVGTTVQSFVEDKNISGYMLSLNSYEVNPTSGLVFKEGDSLRLGQKTKGNR